MRHVDDLCHERPAQELPIAVLSVSLMDPLAAGTLRIAPLALEDARLCMDRPNDGNMPTKALMFRQKALEQYHGFDVRRATKTGGWRSCEVVLG